ncbi:MAG: trypsin-like peptidase domain-containing protein [Alphaproteobacteria bacterium]|nr:trypsin-like peptidase domain-containing protein [Alphaproteobacteria bacterium]MBV8406195.1 trypsin-like peptidase domain-containing protein [Alphaproteobacteria bacterium]
MASRIIIRHVSPGREKQIEQFGLDGLLELSVGRDPSCNIVFDATRDDYVSRRHMAIRVENGERFLLVDLGSRNGTLLNGQATTGETELAPGDVIELGLGGPKFTFDVEPRPANFLKRTRVLPKGVPATRVSASDTRAANARPVNVGPVNVGPVNAGPVSAGPANAGPVNAGSAHPSPPSTAPEAKPAVAAKPAVPAEPAKTSVGRNTVLGMLAAQQTRTNRNWMYVLGGVLLLVIAGGGGLYVHGRLKAEELTRQAEQLKEQQEAAATEAEKQAAELRAQREAAIATAAKQAAELKAQRDAAEKAREENQAALRKAVGLSPKEIVQKYGNAVVLVEMQWHIFDSVSGQPVFQKIFTRVINGKKVFFPAYVLLSDDKVVRWLTTDDENQSNLPVGMGGSGTAFVTSSQGYLLTNKHVAAGWTKIFVEDLKCVQTGPCPAGVAFPVNGQGQAVEFNPVTVPSLRSWIPEQGMIFRADSPTPIGGSSEHRLEGRNDRLEVGFPGNPLRVDASLMRASVAADVALIKIDTEQRLTTVELSDGSPAAVGEQVTALGYPDYSFGDLSIAVIGSSDRSSAVAQKRIVPEPTVTSGNISLITSGAARSGGVTTIGPGDTYQITATISHGNSGGPLFDRTGKVIGIVTYGSDRETTNYAVPIKFGLELLRVQR